MMRASSLSLLLLAACGTEPSSTSSALTREPGECSDIEVHVIGVSDGGDSSTVVLQRPGKHILVLSSYEATHWNIEVHPGATLERVYAVGHNPQRVTANVLTKIETESAMEGGADVGGFAYPDNGTAALLKLASIRVDRHATSFHGCFSASRWTIGTDMRVTSDCATGHTQYDVVTDCDGDNVCDGSGGGGGSGSGGGSDGSLY